MISNSSPIFKHHRTMPADDAPPTEIDNNDHYAVHEYKKCMEHIKQDNPNLATGAIQKMALERCSAMIHEEQQHRGRNNKKLFAEPAADLFRGMMSKLRLGGGNRGNNRTRSDGVAGGQDELAGTIGSSTEEPNEEFVAKRGRSIAARKSVALSSEEGSATAHALAQLSGDINSEDDDEESLSHSLQNIEKQQFSPEIRRRRQSKRLSKRVSEISCLSLSDVEEDEETKLSKKRGGTLGLSSSSKGEEKRQASLKKEESVTKLLPDEIKVLLNDFGAVAANKNYTENRTTTANAAHAPSQSDGQQQEGGVRNKVQNDDARSSNNSSYSKLSMLSVDSDAFGGDFSAWASARRLSNCSNST